MVLSTLVALIANQLTEATGMGITATKLEERKFFSIEKGDFMLMYGSPQAGLNETYTHLLADKVSQMNCFAVDEVHKVYGILLL